MAKVQRDRRAASKPQKQGLNDRHLQDICGLCLCFLGIAGLICLLWPQGALVPTLVDRGLRVLAGVAAYAVPVLTFFAGTMFLRGYQRLSLSHSSYGSLLLVLVCVTWRHLAMFEDPGRWTNDQVRAAGGWLGAMLGGPLYVLVGKPIGYAALVTLALIGTVLIVDQPFIEIMRWLHARGRDGARAARERLTLASDPPFEEDEEDKEPARQIAPARSRGGRAGANGDPGETNAERTARAARVVERALATAPVEPETETVPEHPHTRSRFPNLFNLTRRRWDRPNDAEDDEEYPEEAPAVDVPEPPVREKRSRSATERQRQEPAARSTAAVSAVVADSTSERPEPAGDGKPVPTTPVAPPPVVPEFVLPPLTLLNEAPVATSKRSQNELTDNVSKIEQTLEQFNIGANVVEVASGPSITRYEIQLAPGIKVSKIVSLADNLAMSLAAIDVRVEAPIPGKSAIGVEVPNATPMMVSLRECLDNDEYRNAPSKLTIALGKDVAGQYKYADITKMPHLLIGGSTNSGKSVCLNSLIASLVYRATPREVKMLMIDPKRVELSLWDGIPHLMHPVVKDVKQAAGIFRAAIKEMDRRYDLFAALGTRNIDGYNQRVPETEKLPYLVLIVDELADLMIQQGPEVEQSICRLAQLARATGIHLVIATQRPSVDIITGTIKANISSRIAFAVASQVDSRTILDMTGADRLIGRGDMLFMPIDAAKPIRIQGCYLSENETNALVQYLKDQEKPAFNFTVADSGGGVDAGRNGASADDEVDDQFFEQAVRLVVNNGQASTSMLQRRFRIGYTRAARIVEMMEEKGIVGPLNGAKPREILVSKDEVEQMFNPGGPLPSVAGYRDED
jgi:S-DNA-T family DNA segregation ATPase FtsK/SpoIIIE